MDAELLNTLTVGDIIVFMKDNITREVVSMNKAYEDMQTYSDSFRLDDQRTYSRADLEDMLADGKIKIVKWQSFAI